MFTPSLWLQYRSSRPRRLLALIMYNLRWLNSNPWSRSCRRRPCLWLIRSNRVRLTYWLMRRPYPYSSRYYLPIYVCNIVWHAGANHSRSMSSKPDNIFSRWTHDNIACRPIILNLDGLFRSRCARWSISWQSVMRFQTHKIEVVAIIQHSNVMICYGHLYVFQTAWSHICLVYGSVGTGALPENMCITATWSSLW